MAYKRLWNILSHVRVTVFKNSDEFICMDIHIFKLHLITTLSLWSAYLDDISAVKKIYWVSRIIGFFVYWLINVLDEFWIPTKFFCHDLYHKLKCSYNGYHIPYILLYFSTLNQNNRSKCFFQSKKN